MKCRKCHKDISDGSKFCSHCGVRQEASHAPKSRGNGQGSVFKRGNTWTAIITIGYEADGAHTRRVTRSKSGFKTKKEAVNYLPQLALTKPEPKSITLQKLYDAWLPTHRAGASTLSCYKAAWKYFRPIQFMKVQDITVDDLQDCVDECPYGRRTKENMKALCGLMYKYGIPRHIVSLNLGEYLKVSGDTGTKDGLPMEALSAIESAVGTVPGADYVMCQCYLGFRPSEFLALDVAHYNRKERAFVGGAKTDAGRDRTVTVSPKIQPIIDRLVRDRIHGAVFCDSSGKPLSIEAYRSLFYSVLEACGIDNPTAEVAGAQVHKYTPHSCRHTFATLMKRVVGADKDKLSLIGHTSESMLRHYQDVSFDDLRKVTDAM